MQKKDEEIETLDFENDAKVSSGIDDMLEMLDFEDISSNDKAETLELTTNLDDLLETSDAKSKIEIDASEERLDEYKPSIKDFNIKNAKTRKIVRKSMVYVIILMLLGFEIFISKAGNMLNSIKVYASDNVPIKIMQNDKYGYVDEYGDKLVNAKYNYAEDFIKQYAIVKNGSNLPLVIDKAGKEVIKASTYFSLYRADTDIIASKTTKSGLKYGVLDSSLKEKVSFKYDMITYVGSVYTFVKGNTVGLINLEGKEIYTYKLSSDDDKKIDVLVSKTTEKTSQMYGVVTVNKSSQVVNINTGVEVTQPTLNEMTAEDNNIFTITRDTNKEYDYVLDDKVIISSESYNSLSISSISSGVLKAITNDYGYEFISSKTYEQLKKGLGVNDAFVGMGIFMYNEHDYKANKDVIIMVKNGEAYKTIDGFSIYKPFKNGIAIVRFDDDTYGYINEDGNLITEQRFIEAGEFDSYGDAIAKTNDGYGVINKNGKTIISFVNNDVKMAYDIVKLTTARDSKNIFYAVMKDSNYELYNSKGKKIDKEYYTNIEFDTTYPMIKLSTDTNDMVMFSSTYKSINITSFNNKYEAHDNYIIYKNEYYNYNGKMIYKDNSKSDGDSNG